MLIHAWIEIGLADRGDLNFDKSFLQFNVVKKAYTKSLFKETFSIWLEMLSTRHLLGFEGYLFSYYLRKII